MIVVSFISMTQSRIASLSEYGIITILKYPDVAWMKLKMHLTYGLILFDIKHKICLFSSIKDKSIQNVIFHYYNQYFYLISLIATLIVAVLFSFLIVLLLALFSSADVWMMTLNIKLIHK